MKYKVMLLIGVFLAVMGCQNSELNNLKTDLNKLKASAKAAEKKIEELKSSNRDLERKLEKVNSKNNNLHIQKRETDEWIGAIIKRIGPCVWAIGQFQKPMPVEMMPNGTPFDLIAKLNIKFKSENCPEATLMKVEDKIAFIKIVQDKKLTQEMGTFGASAYINSIAYTLYSVNDIKCIKFDFEEGDHAFPGTYCPGMVHKQESIKNI